MATDFSVKAYIFSSFILLLTQIDGKAVPTILETDIGSAYDDHLALTYMLSRRDLFDLKLIVCSTSNTSARAQIVAKILSIFQRFDIPIAIGRSINDSNQVIYGYRWAEDYPLEKFQNDSGIIFSNGEQTLMDEIKKATSQNVYHYIQISPAVALGNILEKDPSLSVHIRLFAMAGSMRKGYDNSNTVSKEYNVEYNIQSAQRMFASTWAYFGLAPLDCTNFMQFSDVVWKTFLSRRNTSRFVDMIVESFTIWYNDGGQNMSSILPYTPQLGTPEMHDILAVYLSGIYPSISPTVSEDLPLFVTSDGFTRENQTIGRQINTCLKYETMNPYVATAQIGSSVLESIAQADSRIENNGHRYSKNVHRLIILSIVLSLSFYCEKLIGNSI